MLPRVMGSEPLILAAFVSVVVGYFVTKMTLRRFRAAAWEAVASELDLTIAGEFTVEGKLSGVEVSAHAYSRRASSNNREWHTQFEARVDRSGLPDGLELRREGIIHKVGEALGLEDHKIGVEEIDGKLRIQAANASELDKWASQPHIIDGLRTMAKSVDDYELIDGTLRTVTYGIASQKWLKAGLKRTARIAAALSGPAN